jgi:hypothetical protein
MTVKRLRIHVAVSDRGQRLHTEEERIGKGTGRHTGDVVLAEEVKQSKNEIESDINDGDKEGELRPAQSKQPLIGVAPIDALGVDLEKLDLAGAN